MYWVYLNVLMMKKRSWKIFKVKTKDYQHQQKLLSPTENTAPETSRQ